MMKQPLGKALFALFMSFPLFADVTASVDNPAVYRGDPVTLTLTASGDDIRFPPLTEIAGYRIESRGTSKRIAIINGKTTRTVEQRLTFTPTADVTVPVLDITIDGTAEHTLPLHVKVLDPAAAPQGAPIRMEMVLSKNDVHVGEPVKLDLVFKYKPGTQIDDIKISEPKLEHLWIKRINDQPERAADSEGYITQTYSYLLFAQQSGTLQIPAIFAQVGTRVQTNRTSRFGGDIFFNDPFFGAARMQYRKVFSEPATLNVTALPDNLEVYGAFTMRSDIDKTAVDANKPVNINIHIEGRGNVEDIKGFDPSVENAVVYANDPVVKGYFKDGEYFGTFDQTIAVIPERDTTIKPMSFPFFDSRTNDVNTLRTRPYFITVKGAIPASASAPHLESAASATAPQTPGRVRQGFSLEVAAGIFAVGFVVGAAFIGMIALRRKERTAKKPKETPMAKRVRKAKKAPELFALLLPHKGEAAVIDEALARLEAHLYRGEKYKVDRNALMDHFNTKTPEPVELV